MNLPTHTISTDMPNISLIFQTPVRRREPLTKAHRRVRRFRASHVGLEEQANNAFGLGYKM